ncbi:MAG TPA: bacillithiol biosynthesis BshC, partial [Myxococcota bacterium]|nr:bacillithiol biosynthesis BshC [Myxococcota bacterium]
MSSPFTPAWSSHEANAVSLLPNPLVTSETLTAHAKALLKERRLKDRAHTSREVLDVLAAQEVGRPQSEARRHNLERLAQGALVVATGQQVGLFLGPLYALHKAATAIAWARELERRLEHPVVPLFWLQTEDADFDEVKTTWLPGSDGLQQLTLEPGPTVDGRPLDVNARVSLGHRQIGPSIAAALDAARAALSGPHAETTLALLERFYRPDRTLGEAAGELMAELFADSGLLVFDPRPARGPSPSETTPFKEALAFALNTHDRIEAALSDRAAALEQAGFDVQVKVRERTSLACHHPDGPCGDRYRLVRRPGTRWALSGHPGELDHEDALDDTTRLSTTALLRPLLQDRLFPTV